MFCCFLIGSDCSMMTPAARGYTLEPIREPKTTSESHIRGGRERANRTVHTSRVVYGDYNHAVYKTEARTRPLCAQN